MPLCQTVRIQILKTNSMNNLDEIIITGVVFFGIYQALSLISSHLLKRKLIKAEQYERVGILDDPRPANDEANKYPSLKWGLVALMTGLGFIVIELLGLLDKEWIQGRDTVMPFGILLVSISSGFLIYFFIVNGKKK
jgi:hypothetical protein